jgi:penicillin-binding protein 1A
MMRKRQPKRRIEPAFETGRQRGGEMRVDRGDRLAGNAGPARRARSGGGSGRGGGGRRRSGGRKARSTRRVGFFGLIRGLVYWSFVLGIWAAIGLGGVVIYYAAQMPNAATWEVPDRPPNVRIVSVGDQLLANRGATGGEQLALTDMSPFIPQAVMAIEDRRFPHHFGVDPFGLARAMLANIMAGEVVQGGSTITQQLAKNLFLSPEQTIERKVQELLLALWLEQKFTKDQIMEMYLNRVYFGSNAYGVGAASRRYFDKPASEVTLSEAALLAGLLKAPSRLSPANDPQAADARAQVVLQAMRDAGYIDDAQATTAMTQSPTRAPSFWTGSEHYVADAVMDRLEGIVGEIEQDLVVETTVDIQLQQMAEDAISGALAENSEALNVGQGALISIDATGAIRAMVGGRDYATSQYNRAADARRQPGSAFKPFVYGAAIEMGISPLAVRNDAPVRIGNWTPENYSQDYSGPVTLAEALTRSLNTIAAQLVMEVGPENVVAFAKRLGIDSELKPNASIALGTSEVTLEDLTAAYAAFMNGGYLAEPYLISRVTTVDGEVLYERDAPPAERVLEPYVAGVMNDMLTRVVQRGTGHNAQIEGWQVAGKTGTTQSFRDALFVGYTANLATGVWFGNDDGDPMTKVTGGGLPAETWANFMSGAHQGVPVAALPGGPPGLLDGELPPAEMPRDGIGAIIAGSRPGGNDPSRWGPDVLGARNAPVPPAAVGEGDWQSPSGPPPTERTTLLDFLLGN